MPKLPLSCCEIDIRTLIEVERPFFKELSDRVYVCGCVLTGIVDSGRRRWNLFCFCCIWHQDRPFWRLCLCRVGVYNLLCG